MTTPAPASGAIVLDGPAGAPPPAAPLPAAEPAGGPESPPPVAGVAPVAAPTPATEPSPGPAATPVEARGDAGAFYVELAARQQQPINYGTGDVLLDETGVFGEVGLLGRFSPLPWLGWSIGGSLGAGMTTFVDSLNVAELELRGDVSVYAKPLVTDSIEIWSGPTLHAGGALVDAYDSSYGTPDDDAFNGFVGAGFFARVWLGSFYIEPDYRFRHTGVTAHYLGGQLGVDLGSIELYADLEQRVGAAGGVSTSIYDFATSYFQTAPAKTYVALGIAFGF